jgi:hypothetical protein
VKTTPDPAPAGPRRERRAMLTTAGPTSSTTPTTALEYASSTSASKPNGASIQANVRTRAAASTVRGGERRAWCAEHRTARAWTIA